MPLSSEEEKSFRQLRARGGGKKKKDPSFLSSRWRRGKERGGGKIGIKNGLTTCLFFLSLLTGFRA